MLKGPYKAIRVFNNEPIRHSDDPISFSYGIIRHLDGPTYALKRPIKLLKGSQSALSDGTITYISVSDDHFRFSYGPTILSYGPIKLPGGPMRHSDGLSGSQMALTSSQMAYRAHTLYLLLLQMALSGTQMALWLTRHSGLR